MTGHQTRYKQLFTPLRLGPVTIANRIVFSAHLTNYAEDGLPSQQHAAYYAARARGGAGLVITEEHSTHPTDWPYEKLIASAGKEPVWETLALAVPAPVAALNISSLSISRVAL